MMRLRWLRLKAWFRRTFNDPPRGACTVGPGGQFATVEEAVFRRYNDITIEAHVTLEHGDRIKLPTEGRISINRIPKGEYSASYNKEERDEQSKRVKESTTG